MKSAEIRQAFLDYFAQQGHQVVPSSSLVPANDPSLLFTNAGMVQFKDVFLGAESRPYQRAVSSQRCVRAGGKHNDLENVGYTARHHTFFEMLGNFSFGDYFKEDAIRFAWEFLTEVLKLPTEKLWVTVHISDDEAADIWVNNIGIDPARMSRLDADNFWQMGDTGPCGPSSEIFYDHGESVFGDPPGGPNDDGDRYIEIWNLVFMQFNRQANGDMTPLPNPSIDTGMGLERVAAVMQHVHNNYDIDLFQALLAAAATATGSNNLKAQSLRVIADHIRSCSFLIVDGVLPSNEGRGYVLRRIIRRALRHGNKLGAPALFFYTLVDSLVAEMGEAYPELVAKADMVKDVIKAEETQFGRTLDKGMAVLEEAVAHASSNVIDGETIFKLHDTYGFPTDLTNDIARERNLSLDMDGFEVCMQQQRARARASSRFSSSDALPLPAGSETRFTGYESSQGEGKVQALFVAGEAVNSIDPGQDAIVVLDSTTFYAESGGQAGDSGLLVADHAKFEVRDCAKQGQTHLHLGELSQGTLSVGDTVATHVSAPQRDATVLNHSATHLLHAALRKLLGDHVTQQGSQVTQHRLRFDFSHSKPVSPDEQTALETLVNQQIRLNSAANIALMSIDDAKESGAMMLFDEKYGDQVRVLTLGNGFSVELCGGTHVKRTGDIGLFKIISESGVASGVRRIEAITGADAIEYVQNQQRQLQVVSDTLKTDQQNLLNKAEALVAQNRDLQKQLDQARVKLASSSGSDLSSEAVEVNGVKLLAKKLDGMAPKNLRDMVDQLRNKLGSGIVVLATENNGKVALVCGVTADLKGQYPAGKLLAQIAPEVGGKGGGRPDLAQGGGSQPENIQKALDAASRWVASV